MPFVDKEILKNEKIQNHAQQIMSQLINILKTEKDNTKQDVRAILAVYILYKISTLTNTQVSYRDIVKGKLNINQEVVYAFNNVITEKTWNNCLKILENYTSVDFACALLLPIKNIPFYNSSNNETPESIVKLAKKILDCKSHEVVADIGCGMGNFLLSTALDNSEVWFEGYELSRDCQLVSSIRSEIIKAPINIYLQNAFELIISNKSCKKFDKIFANYPFGLRIRNLGVGALYLDNLAKKYPGLSKATSSDWIFNSLLCDLLKDDGKAVAIITNGSTWNSIDKKMIRHFVEQGLIEAVVTLPERMFSNTSISTSLIILSKGNKNIRLVDATNVYQSGRRQNSLSDANILTIYDLLKNDAENSRVIELSDLRKNDYTLNLSRYVDTELIFKNGVVFESVIKKITRGAPCTASQLDSMISETVTNKQFLMLNNIQDGSINNNLPYLSKIPEQYRKYCLKNKDIVISKNGYPYKIAVVNIKEEQQILASGNFYVIKVDESKINPYYLQAFLDSEQGNRVLKSISVGSAVPNISIDKLTKINIPLPSLEKQEIIANNYKSIIDEIAVIKLKLEKALNKMHQVFNEGEL